MRPTALIAAIVALFAAFLPAAGTASPPSSPNYADRQVATLLKRHPGATRLDTNTVKLANGLMVTVPNRPGGTAPPTPTATGSRTAPRAIAGCRVYQYCWYTLPSWDGQRVTIPKSKKKGRASDFLNNSAQSWMNRKTGCRFIGYDGRNFNKRVLWKAKPRTRMGRIKPRNIVRLSSWRCR